MDPNDKLKVAGQQVEAVAAELIEEFKDHYLEYVALHPEYIEKKRDIFEGWVIQKIAGLQIAVTELAKHANAAINLDNLAN